MKAKNLAFWLAQLLVAALPPASIAGPFTFTNIADTSGPFFSVDTGPALNSSGTVAFGVQLDGGGTALYKGNGGALTLIADTSGPLSVVSNQPLRAITATGDVVFTARLDDGTNSILIGNGGALTTIVNSSGPINGFPGDHTVDANAAGKVVFSASLDGGGFGLFSWDGGTLHTLATIFGTSSFSIAAINNNGDIAYRELNVVDRIYRTDGVNPPVLISQAVFNENQFGPDMNDSGTVVFRTFSGPQAIYTGNGGPLTKIVDTTGPLSSIPQIPAINNSGVVVFHANFDAGGEGIFSTNDLLNPIIRTGDSLFGSTVTELSFTREGLNDNGQIAFQYWLRDGRQGIARADLVVPVAAAPAPPVTALLVSALLALGWNRRKFS